MKKLPLALTASALLFSSFSAQAALIYGAEAFTAVARCPSFCTSFTSGNSEGGEGETSTAISSVSNFRGDAQASASLGGGLSTPILKAEAYANPTNNGAFGSAFAVQGYTYNGPGETLTLDIFLDGLVTDPEQDSSDTDVTMEVVLYDSSNFYFTTDRGTLDFEAGATPLMQSGGGEASVFLELDHTNPMSDSGSISVDVATGDELYLWTFLSADAESGFNPTSADAFNTGTMGFQGAPDLLAAASPVPVPAAVWLFGSGMIGLFGVARRRKA